MSSVLKRLHSATGTVALGVALLALLTSAAGVGYAAATVGTKDIKKNAVTASKIKKNAVTAKKIKKNAVNSVKVKDGSLTNADLVPEEARQAPTFSNGGEGDCIWQHPDVVLPGYGLGGVTFRKDRSSVVRLSGIAVGDDAPGGDAVCDDSAPGQISDGIAFTLPAGYVPAKTLLIPVGSDAIIIAGPNGLTAPGVFLPPGSVYTGSGAVILDGITFDPAGSSVALAKGKARGQAPSGGLLQGLS